jgi:glycosyltransferase involved in cell wall biosynthesis
MKIGLVIYGDLNTVSGGYRYDRRLVDHLRQAGHDVEMISLEPREYRKTLLDNVTPKLWRRLRRLDIDLLLEDELNHSSLFALNLFLRRRVQFPIISIVHHLRSSEPRSNWQNHLYAAVERRYLKTVDGMIFNSRTTEQTVGALTGQTKPSVVVLPGRESDPPEIDDAWFERRARRPGPLRVVFLGNLIPRKGVHTLLEAMSRLPAGRAVLTMIGSLDVDPEYAREMQQYVHQLAVGGRVSMTGPLPDRAVQALLRESDVLAVPSTYEGFGMVYLEGMAYGLPAIASTAGAASEFVEDGRNGYLVDPDDAAKIARHLLHLAGDWRALVNMSRAARSTYLAHPTWDDSMSLARRFLESMVKRNA